MNYSTTAMNPILGALLDVIQLVLNLYIWVLVAGAILSWLIVLNIVNRGNRFVQVTGDFITRVTEPLLRPIRRVVPPMGGLDLSPLVLILIIIFVRSLIWRFIIY